MDASNLMANAIATLVVGVIVLAVEYHYFKRKEERKTSSSEQAKDGAAQKTPISHTAEASIYSTSTDFSPLVPYKYLAVGFIGSIWGVVPAVSLALIASNSSSTSPSTAAQIFGFATLPAVVGGSVLALWADRKFGMEKARMRLRLPLAAIFGIIGGVIFPLLTPLIACLAITIICILVIYSLRRPLGMIFEAFLRGLTERPE